MVTARKPATGTTGTPTVYDVAERASVSIATVSRVYRSPDAVRAPTREKVLAAARDLGYVPSGSARGLASRTTGILGLCIPDYADPETDAPGDGDENAATLYADHIIRGMERAARSRGFALLVAASLRDDPTSLVATVAGHVDGFAVMSRTVAARELETVSRRMPVVMLAGPPELDHLDNVQVDNRDGQRELTRHLIEEHGLADLAFVGGPADSPDAEARFLGYRDACRDAGLPVPAEPALRGDLTRTAGRDAARVLIDAAASGAVSRAGAASGSAAASGAVPGAASGAASGGGPDPAAGLPDALILANDQMAVGALEEFAAHGVRVPEHIAVTGFDGIPLGAMAQPPLTTVRQPSRRIGEEAVALLVDRIGAPAREPHAVVLPVTLVLRASCGCVEPVPAPRRG
ncbi:putative LacI family transcriptional regulator [Actinacidiphila reveromycinica]|uniref:Putative LacI family transcriptional regulator n=1 Tax=Actinacidiphila reveromycinica TaxID=659352 RepID=A0A7U3UTG3_9ACTN|nr:LacI family DNA-binding transcriptional regulator [Streptomyces sp. SN-593]BBA98423.1 putative LacI family transcriptional regulator [Streptomyces sp. SN-593]